MVYTIFDKKISGGAATLAQSDILVTRNKSAIKNELMRQLAEELQKTIIIKTILIK